MFEELADLVAIEKQEEEVIPQLVIFFGPPCSGKTFHFENTYAESHIRIAPPEIYKAQKGTSFHRIINTVIEHLSNKQNVVIDDQNTLPRTRNSYIKAIKDAQTQKKLLQVKIIAVCFQPLGSITQCLWANEWALAEHFKNPEKSVFQPTQATDLEEWFNIGQHPPTKGEGFNEIIQIRSKIHCNQTELLDKSALFIDASSIFYFEKKENGELDERDLKLLTRPNSSTRMAYEKGFQQYHQEHPEGAIIILVDESALFPMILEIESFEKQQKMVAKWRKQFRTYVENWATILQVPVSYVIAEYGSLEPNSFFMMPNQGMVAYAQFIHQLDLRKSIFISDDNEKSSLGFSLGLSCVISARNFFCDSGWNVTSKLRKLSVDFSDYYLDFLDVVEYRDMNRPDDFYSFEGEFHSGIGRLHGCCQPSVSLAELYFDDDDIMGEMPRPIVIESVSQPTGSLQTSNTTATEENSNSLSAPQQKVPTLSEAYIRSVVTPSTFERGMQYHNYDTIFNRRQRGFLLTGMCKGSSAPPYSIQVKLSSKAEKIVSASCSCPIGSGKCKHIAAFLLSWVHSSDKFKKNPLGTNTPLPSSPVPPTPQKLKKNSLGTNMPQKETLEKQQTETPAKQKALNTVCKEEFMSKNPGKRKLPRWMNQDGDSPPKKQKIGRRADKEKAIRPKVIEIEDVPSTCNQLHVSPKNNAIVQSTSSPKRIRTVAEVLADLDRELESDDIEQTSENVNNELVESKTLSPKPVSLKAQLANVD